MSEAGPGWRPSRPGGDSDQGQESGERGGTESAHGDGGCGGIDAMFDRLREAAAAHDDDD